MKLKNSLIVGGVVSAMVTGLVLCYVGQAVVDWFQLRRQDDKN